jgi:glutathione synthase/RimK-type ligase-like ATP-grasp enzyme
MRRICFLSMDSLDGYTFDDNLAIEPLRVLEFEVSTISWRDQSVDWNDFEAVIIRTTWDYQKSPAEFLEVLRKIDASNARLENSLAIVEWNLAKTYLRELEAKGVRIVPTIWDETSVSKPKFDEWKAYFTTDELIIKPIISATAEFTYRLSDFDENLTEVFTNKPFMVQPFMPNVVEEGEFSLFYFGEKYSHTILKTPKAKDFRVQEEYGGIIQAVEPSAKLRAAADKVLDCIKPLPLYLRVDFVRDENDDFCLMELELIEPSMYIRMDDQAPISFAKAVAKLLN